MCRLAATGLSQSGVMPSPSQEQLQEQAAEVAASSHSWRGSNPQQSDIPATAASIQPMSARTSDNAALGAGQQQGPADLGEVDLAAASEAAIDNSLTAAAGSLTGDQSASRAAIDSALAAAAAAGSLTDDVATSEAAVDSASAAAAAAAAAESLTADMLQAGSSQYLRPLSPGSTLLRAAQGQRQAINGAITAAESSTDAALQADSSQRLRTQVPDKALLSPADLQQPADLTQDLAASEAAVDSALAAATESLAAADAPQPDSSQHLRTQIPNNALLTAREQQQPADLTEDLAASEAAVDSALAAAATSFTAAVPQLDSRQYSVRPLSPGSSLLRAAQLQRRAIDNALAAAGGGGDSMRRDPELSAAEQVHLTNELTRSKAAVEAALTEARESELTAAAAADSNWSLVQGQGESALPLSTAPNSQLPVEEASLEPMTVDPSAAAAAVSAPASVVDDSLAFSPFAAPTDLSPMAAERIKAAIAQGVGLAPPTSSSSDPFLTAQTGGDTAAAAVQEADQAVARLKDDAALLGSLTDAAAEDIAAAAGEAADEAPSGSGVTPYGGWVSDTQSDLGMATSNSATPVPGVSPVVPPPAELSQELAADLQEIQSLRSQVRLAYPLLIGTLVSLLGLLLACTGIKG